MFNTRVLKRVLKIRGFHVAMSENMAVGSEAALYCDQYV